MKYDKMQIILIQLTVYRINNNNKKKIQLTIKYPRLTNRGVLFRIGTMTLYH